MRLKMYANRRYWEADRNEDDLWVVGMKKMGVFPDPGIRTLPFDPMSGDEGGSIPCMSEKQPRHFEQYRKPE